MRDETRMLLESMNRLFEDHCTKRWPIARKPARSRERCGRR